MDARPPLSQSTRTDGLPSPTFDDLTFGGQVSVWALRLWSQGDQGCSAAHRLLREGFAVMGIEAAHLAMNELLSLVDHSRGHALDFRRSGSRELSHDERLFLDVLADQQRGALTSAYRRLAAWMGNSDPRSAMGAAMELATLFQERRLLVDPPAP